MSDHFHRSLLTTSVMRSLRSRTSLPSQRLGVRGVEGERDSCLPNPLRRTQLLQAPLPRTRRPLAAPPPGSNGPSAGGLPTWTSRTRVNSVAPYPKKKQRGPEKHALPNFATEYQQSQAVLRQRFPISLAKMSASHLPRGPGGGNKSLTCFARTQQSLADISS